MSDDHHKLSSEQAAELKKAALHHSIEAAPAIHSQQKAQEVAQHTAILKHDIKEGALHHDNVVAKKTVAQRDSEHPEFKQVLSDVKKE